MAARKGAKHHMAKMDAASVRAARDTFKNGSFIMVDGKRQPITVAALARKYGIAPQSMHSILKGDTWKHVR